MPRYVPYGVADFSLWKNSWIFLLVLREIKVCSPADNHIIYYAFLVFGYVNAVEYLKSKNSEMTD
jgi:hypothetical protein